MIKNQKQAGITRDKIEELKKGKKELESQKEKMEPAKYELGLKAFNGLIKELEEQLRLYNSLIEGNFNCVQPKSLEDVPNVLISARLAQKLSQEDLGKLIGLKGQQIQRYEATDYETAAWPRIVEIAIALKLEVYLKCWIKQKNKNEMLFTFPTNKTKEQVGEAQRRLKSMGHLIFLSN